MESWNKAARAPEGLGSPIAHEKHKNLYQGVLLGDFIECHLLKGINPRTGTTSTGHAIIYGIYEEGGKITALDILPVRDWGHDTASHEMEVYNNNDGLSPFVIETASCLTVPYTGDHFVPPSREARSLRFDAWPCLLEQRQTALAVPASTSLLQRAQLPDAGALVNRDGVTRLGFTLTPYSKPQRNNFYPDIERKGEALIRQHPEYCFIPLPAPAEMPGIILQ